MLNIWSKLNKNYKDVPMINMINITLFKVVVLIQVVVVLVVIVVVAAAAAVIVVVVVY